MAPDSQFKMLSAAGIGVSLLWRTLLDAAGGGVFAADRLRGPRGGEPKERVGQVMHSSCRHASLSEAFRSGEKGLHQCDVVEIEWNNIFPFNLESCQIECTLNRRKLPLAAPASTSSQMAHTAPA